VQRFLVVIARAGDETAGGDESECRACGQSR
jgi:hypothetical protein